MHEDQLDFEDDQAREDMFGELESEHNNNANNSNKDKRSGNDTEPKRRQLSKRTALQRQKVTIISILWIIDSTSLPTNSPIKGHIRCPGTRQLIKHIKRLDFCDVYYVDEFRTTKTCSKCYDLFALLYRKAIDKCNVQNSKKELYFLRLTSSSNRARMLSRERHSSQHRRLFRTETMRRVTF